MTPTELRNEVHMLCDGIGERASISIGLGSRMDEEPIYMMLYPNWPSSTCITVRGETWRECLDKLRSQWDVAKVTRQKEVVPQMALKIIELSVKTGKPNVYLRGSYSDNEIKYFGGEAIAFANRISNLGPFSIVDTR